MMEEKINSLSMKKIMSNIKKIMLKATNKVTNFHNETTEQDNSSDSLDDYLNVPHKYVIYKELVTTSDTVSVASSHSGYSKKKALHNRKVVDLSEVDSDTASTSNYSGYYSDSEYSKSASSVARSIPINSWKVDEDGFLNTQDIISSFMDTETSTFVTKILGQSSRFSYDDDDDDSGSMSE
jgi:hypothetical protein